MPSAAMVLKGKVLWVPTGSEKTGKVPGVGSRVHTRNHGGGWYMRILRITLTFGTLCILKKNETMNLDDNFETTERRVWDLMHCLEQRLARDRDSRGYFTWGMTASLNRIFLHITGELTRFTTRHGLQDTISRTNEEFVFRKVVLENPWTNLRPGMPLDFMAVLPTDAICDTGQVTSLTDLASDTMHIIAGLLDLYGLFRTAVTGKGLRTGMTRECLDQKHFILYDMETEAMAETCYSMSLERYHAKLQELRQRRDQYYEESYSESSGYDSDNHYHPSTRRRVCRKQVWDDDVGLASRDTLAMRLRKQVRWTSVPATLNRNLYKLPDTMLFHVNRMNQDLAKLRWDKYYALGGPFAY